MLYFINEIYIGSKLVGAAYIKCEGKVYFVGIMTERNEAGAWLLSSFTANESLL